jgi:hypothetical protein
MYSTWSFNIARFISENSRYLVVPCETSNDFWRNRGRIFALRAIFLVSRKKDEMVICANFLATTEAGENTRLDKINVFSKLVHRNNHNCRQYTSFAYFCTLKICVTVFTIQKWLKPHFVVFCGFAVVRVLSAEIVKRFCTLVPSETNIDFFSSRLSMSRAICIRNEGFHRAGRGTVVSSDFSPARNYKIT